MTDEAEIHANKRTDKTYVSPRIPTIRGALRIASKVIDSEGMHFATVEEKFCCAELLLVDPKSSQNFWRTTGTLRY